MSGLFPYQRRGVDEIEKRLAAGMCRVVAVAPVAAGKGTMAAHMLADAAKRGRRGVFIVHRREIILDIAKRVRALGVDVGLVLAGKPAHPRAMVQVGSVQTMIARGAPPADLVIIDEAHHYAAEDWSQILASYPMAQIVGFTATPQRADGKALDVFDDIVPVTTYAEMIALGRVVPCTVLRPDRRLGIDLAQDPVDAYLKYATNLPALVFSRRVADAVDVAERLRSAGVAAECIDSATKTSDRDAAVRRMAEGSLSVLTNVATLTEGTDIPRVECIILARTCEHASTYVQMVGRALRSAAGKTGALLIDLPGASHRHGLPTAERAYSLQGDGMGGAAETRSGDGSSPDGRGPSVLGLDMEIVGGEVDTRRAHFDALWVEARTNGYPPAWVARKYHERFAHWPMFDGAAA